MASSTSCRGSRGPPSRGTQTSRAPPHLWGRGVTPGQAPPRQAEGGGATNENRKNGRDVRAADGQMYTKGQPDGLTRAFLDYMLGSTVQGTTIPGLFYAPVK